MREWINLRLFNFIWNWSKHHPNQTMPMWLLVPVKAAYDWSRRHPQGAPSIFRVFNDDATHKRKSSRCGRRCLQKKRRMNG